jgi:hypothetical protein
MAKQQSKQCNQAAKVSSMHDRCSSAAAEAALACCLMTDD